MRKDEMEVIDIIKNDYYSKNSNNNLAIKTFNEAYLRTNAEILLHYILELEDWKRKAMEKGFALIRHDEAANEREGLSGCLELQYLKDFLESEYKIFVDENKRSVFHKDRKTKEVWLYYIWVAKNLYDITTAEGRAKVAAIFYPLLDAMESDEMRAEFLGLLRKELNI